MARLIKFLATLVIGVILGLVLTHLMVTRDPPFGMRSGAWSTWPSSGTVDIDPYARAIYARTGQIPLAATNGLAFLARTDDQGAALDARCAYAVGGPTPQAQYWTLSVLDASDGMPSQSLFRQGFTSAEVVRDAGGNFSIALASTVRPGNWLPIPPSGHFALMLSFYDTPLTAALLQGAAMPQLPAIAKRSCA